ncbi:sulfatase family protein [Crateriforma conspicua]|uniref:Choline-sulfatase n=1 Tax=Crateriforma conspicua TaxID=2527996 RepID=A0A5C5Y8R7_9PLAN|nr:sulfatase [Crateriforma conspicua]QDV61672.1 Choline-sulfatase [Crateriforma conspicua]TWT72077.1 Choline-sulfatase [Crateriforma conspicua]
MVLCRCTRLLHSRLVALVGAVIVLSQSAGAASPNVLVIITDEHNFRTLGCYRDLMPAEQAEMWGPGAIVPTPHLDRLADEGGICTRAFATSPVCSPSRAAMITGLYPHTTGVPANDLELRQDIPTLATVLGDAGYRTAFVGKWHLGGDSKPGWAPKIDGGFQYSEFMFNRGHWKKLQVTDDGPEVAARDKRGDPSYSVADADDQTFTTDFLTDRTMDFIRDSGDQPFLAVVSYPDPHGPNTVRKPYDTRFESMRFLPPRTYGRDDLPTPNWLGSAKKHPKFQGDLMAQYFGMVQCIDDNIGRMLDLLQSSGKLDNTIVLMTSDHGDLCFEHDRLNKGNPYEGSARVPMLIRYPAAVPAGVVVDQPMGTVDLTPTVVGMTGVSCDATFAGRDLSGVFASSGNASDDDPPVTFLRNAGVKAGWVAAVDPRYKLILSVNDRPWLFDNQADPDELLNFYGRGDSDVVVRRLADALAEYAKATQDPHFDNAKIAAALRQCLTP